MDSSKSTAITAAVVALLVGGGAGYVIGNSNNNDGEQGNVSQNAGTSSGGTDTGAADLRANLQAAQQEHVALASETLRNVFDGTKDAEAAVAALDKNSVEIAEIVGAAYGPDAQDQFLSAWREHIGFFANYTTAAKAGDKAAMEQALADLDGYAEETATFFSEANPNLPKEAVKENLQTHAGLVIDTVNAYGAGNYEESFNKQIEAYDQIGKVSAVLSGAIYQQFPDKFTK